MDQYEAAYAEIVRAKKQVEAALARVTKEEKLGRTARVLNPRRQLLDMLADIGSELAKCEDAYGAMLEGAVVEGDTDRSDRKL